MSDDLVKRWDDYVESMGCVMGEVEHTAQQMRDRIEELEEKLKKALEALEWVKFGGGPRGESYHELACQVLEELKDENERTDGQVSQETR